MNRIITNTIRYILDNVVPPVIRDSRWFMYPMFYVWFKGKNVKLFMDFKSIVYDISEEEFLEIYRNVESFAYNRPTDMNMPSVEYMMSILDKDAASLLDVGCGRGFWLNYLNERKQMRTVGCDVFDNVSTLKKSEYVKGSIYKLPFADNSFDIVTCTHTVEHLRQVTPAIDELKRVAKKQLIIITPCQRYYYYTPDMHLNFYPIASYLQKEIQIDSNTCKNIKGDWVYSGHLNK